LTLSVVEGDLVIGRQATVKGKNMPPKVTVLGVVKCSEGAVFQCSLSAESFEGEGDIVIQGDLEVKDRIRMDIGHLSITGKVKAKKIDVDSDLTVGGNLEVKDYTRAQDIDVGGSFSALGEVDAKKIKVRSSAIIKGGHVNDIEVGGSFESRSLLEFGLIDVEGAVKLTGKNRGGYIIVGGSCKVDGNLKFGKIHSGGVVEISESATGDSLNIGGAVRVGSSLQLSGKLDVGGQVEIGEVLTAMEIDVGSNLKARKVSASKNAKVGGSITTILGVAVGSLEIGRRSEVKGPIRANEVIIGDRASVEDIHAKNIFVGERTRARNLYGENITIESGCHVSGEVYYTESLRTERNVFFAKTPNKVNKLPK
jgi:cytoskeletal protein CcmA (bactofilin family)